MNKNIPENWIVEEVTKLTDKKDASLGKDTFAFIGLVLPSTDQRYIHISRITDAKVGPSGSVVLPYTRYRVPKIFKIEDEWAVVVYSSRAKFDESGAVIASGTVHSARIMATTNVPDDIVAALTSGYALEDISAYSVSSFKDAVDRLTGALGMTLISEKRALERMHLEEGGQDYTKLIINQAMYDSGMSSTIGFGSFDTYSNNFNKSRYLLNKLPYGMVLNRKIPEMERDARANAEIMKKPDYSSGWFPAPIPYVPTKEEMRAMFRPGYTRIGYASFMLPPGGIVCSMQNAVDMKPLLRATNTLKKNHGMGAKEFQMNFHFATTKEVNAVLLPLIRQFYRTPFLPVTNSYLNDTLGIEGIALQAIQLATTPGVPGAIDATVHMSEFNWDAYMPGESGFDSLICYPLFKIWCEGNTKTSEIKGDRMTGEFKWFLPNEELLKKKEALKTRLYSDLRAYELESEDIKHVMLGIHYLSNKEAQDDLSGYAASGTTNQYALRKGGGYTITSDAFVGDVLAIGIDYSHTVTAHSGPALVIKIKDPIFAKEMLSALKDTNLILYKDVKLTFPPVKGEKTRIQGILMSPQVAGKLIEQLNSVINTVDDAGAVKNYASALNDLRTVYFVIPEEKLGVLNMLKSIYEGSAVSKTKISAVRGREAIMEEWEEVVFPSMTIPQVTVSTENLLTTLKTQISDAPLHQFIGRADTYFTVKLTLEKESDVNTLNEMLERIDYLTQRYGGLSHYEGYMKIENELFSLMGVERVLPVSCSIATVEDFPGVFDVTLQLVQFDPEQKSREELKAGYSSEWNNPTGNAVSAYDHTQRTSDSFKDHMVRAEGFKDRLSGVELYPDMCLPTFSEISGWIDLCKKGASAVMRTFPTITSWPWQPSDCARLINPVKSRTYVDPDFYCAPSFPVGTKLVDTMIDSFLGDTESNALDMICETGGHGKLKFNEYLTLNDFDEKAKDNYRLYSEHVAHPAESPGSDTSGVVSAPSGSDDKNPASAKDALVWLSKKGCTKDDLKYIIDYSKQAGLKVGVVARWILQEGGISDTKIQTGRIRGGIGQLDKDAIKEVNAHIKGTTPWGAVAVTLDDRFPRNGSRERAIWTAIQYMKICYNRALSKAKTINCSPKETLGLAVLAYTSGIGSVESALANYSVSAIIADPEKTVTYAFGNKMNRYLPNVLRGMSETSDDYETAYKRLLSNQPDSPVDSPKKQSSTLGRMLSVGDKIAGYPICSQRDVLNAAHGLAGLSGFSEKPGIYYISGTDIQKQNKKIEVAAREIVALGYAVEIKYPIASNASVTHLFVVDPSLNPSASNLVVKKAISDANAMVSEKTKAAASMVGGTTSVSEKDTAGPDYAKCTVKNAFYDPVDGRDMFYDMRHYATAGRLLQAFPTYLLLLVDGGRWLRFWRLYDKWYGMASIYSIDVAKTRKSPVDVAVVRFANMYGHLSKQAAEMPWDDYLSAGQYRPGRWSLEFIANSVRESFWGPPSDDTMRAWAKHTNSLMLKPGARMHIRLGYGSNANNLPVVFNGVISEVPPAGDMIEVTALGDGVELMKKLNPNKKTSKEVYKSHSFFGGGTNPREIIMRIMAPIQFGAFLTQGGLGHDNPHGIEHFGSMQYGYLRVDDAECGMNVYAVSTQAITGDDLNSGQNTGPIRNILSLLNFIPGWGAVDGGYSTFMIGIAAEDASPWDVFTTCARVAPDYMVAVYPFELRSTLFYGKQHWPLRFEYTSEFMRESRPGDDHNRYTGKQQDNVCHWKPFSQIKLVTSATNLIINNIRATAENMYTKCQAIGTHNGYFGGDNQDNDRSLTVELDTDIYQEHQKMLYVTSGLYSTSGQKLKDVLRNLDLMSPSVARQCLNTYAANSLREAVKDMYDGDAIIIGDPSMKPLDRVFLMDSQIQMSGVVEVKECVHSFSFQTGLTTSWSPDLLASLAETADQMSWNWISHFGARFAGAFGVRCMISALLSKASVAKGLTMLLSFRETMKDLRDANVSWASDILRGIALEGIDGIDEILSPFVPEGISIHLYDDPAGALEKKIDEVSESASLFDEVVIRITPRFSDVLKRIRKLFSLAKGDAKYIEPLAKPLTSWLEANEAIEMLTSLGVRSGDARLTKQVADASLASVMKNAAYMNFASLLGKGATLATYIAPLARMAVGGMLVGSLANWLDRKWAVRQCLVLRPLRVAGKEFVAGISGHAGCVVGDQPGFWDGVVTVLTMGRRNFRPEYGTTGRSFSAVSGQGYFYRGLMLTLAAVFGQGTDEFLGKGERDKFYFTEGERLDMKTLAKRMSENDRSSFSSAEASSIIATKVVSGRITSEFGPRIHPVNGGHSMHTGVDIAAPVGSQVSAAGAGRVTYAGWDRIYGYKVVIDHGGGLETMYGHNSRLSVLVGDTVKEGQKIAEVGSTGLSTGPHCHFEKHINGKPVNPM